MPSATNQPVVAGADHVGLAAANKGLRENVEWLHSISSALTDLLREGITLHSGGTPAESLTPRAVKSPSELSIDVTGGQREPVAFEVRGVAVVVAVGTAAKFEASGGKRFEVRERAGLPTAASKD